MAKPSTGWKRSATRSSANKHGPSASGRCGRSSSGLRSLAHRLVWHRIDSLRTPRGDDSAKIRLVRARI